MARLGVFLTALFLAFIAISRSHGESPDGSSPNSARFVSIPVTVTDSTGTHIPGLTTSSFSLSEGGNDRSLESVTEVAPLVIGKDKVRVPFVVVDALGSPDQGEVRKECLQLLADSVVSGFPISLSEINHDGLHEIHGPATSRSVLASALLRLDNEKRFLKDRNELQALQATSEDKSVVDAETERIRRFRQGTIERVNMVNTLLAQLSAFQQLAGALQRARGRKTVIWLTGYFPADVNEAEDRLSLYPIKSVSIDYQKTIDLLNDAQIGLFPVQMKWRRETSETATEPAPMPFPQTTLGDSTIIGLRRIAQWTGGEALAFSGSLQRLVQSAEDRTTSYYLLRFQPEAAKTELKWRSLKVKLSDKSAQVKSPDGLFVFAASK